MIPGEKYVPSGQLQGDTKAMPDRGSSSGVTDSYGADLSADATNRTTGIAGSTKSDAAFDNDAGTEARKDGDEK